MQSTRRHSCYRVLTITLALAGVCASSLAQDGVALLHKMQQALGGADKIAAIRDFGETASAQTFNAQGAPTGGTVRKRVRWIRPNILRRGRRSNRVDLHKPHDSRQLDGVSNPASEA